MKKSNPIIIVCFLTLSLYVAACLFPAVRLDDGTHSHMSFSIGTPFGWQCLLLGWMVEPAAWSANLFLLAGLIYLVCRRPGVATALGVVAALLGLTTLNVRPLQDMRIGFFLWGSSLESFAIGSFVIWRWKLWAVSNAGRPTVEAIPICESTTVETRLTTRDSRSRPSFGRRMDFAFKASIVVAGLVWLTEALLPRGNLSFSPVIVFVVTFLVQLVLFSVLKLIDRSSGGAISNPKYNLGVKSSAESP